MSEKTAAEQLLTFAKTEEGSAALTRALGLISAAEAVKKRLAGTDPASWHPAIQGVIDGATKLEDEILKRHGDQVAAPEG